MWTFKMFGTDVYHLVAAFVVYSILGWFVESVYMSFCNRKLTNRGFAKSPFCPIYGFGAVFGYLALCPLRNNYVLLYLCGAVSATFFEFLVGKLMLRLFGELWWDYNDKPFNYKGIICLESTIAWGFYAIFIITFLHGKILEMIDQYTAGWGVKACKAILLMVFVDYLFRFFSICNISIRQQKEKLFEACQSIRSKWQ